MKISAVVLDMDGLMLDTEPRRRPRGKRCRHGDAVCARLEAAVGRGNSRGRMRARIAGRSARMDQRDSRPRTPERLEAFDDRPLIIEHERHHQVHLILRDAPVLTANLLLFDPRTPDIPKGLG
jgi:hypothetical protein